MALSPVGAYERKEILLKVEDVNLTLGGRRILRDVQIELRNIVRPGLTQGQIVGLLGPSGMGKTQLFRILSGLNQPDSGRVLVTEKGTMVRPGMVGVIAQNYPLFEHRTVLGNLIVASKQAGVADPENRSRILLKEFGLEDQAPKYPAQLSGGQRQRVAILQQFLCSDHFLLMDEPFSGLDPLALDRMCNFLCEMAASDELKTFILVTHDIHAAVKVCDTLWLLGRDHDSEGNPIPGSRIQKSIDLIQRGLAWRKNIERTAEYHATVDEVHDLFAQL